MQSAIDRMPRFSAVIGAERSCGRDSNEHSLRVLWIEENRVQTHPTRARLPFRPRVATAQAGKLVPRLAAVCCTEQRRVFHSRVNGVRIV